MLHLIANELTRITQAPRPVDATIDLRSKWCSGFGIFLLMIFVACSNDARSVNTSDYDHTCVGDKDCEVVFDGQLTCCGPGCPNAAIARTSLERYWSDVSKYTPVCKPALPCALMTEEACGGNRVAVCVNGQCAAVPP